MGLRIISTRRSADLSKRIYGEIGQDLSNKADSLFLLVPEQFTLGAEAQLMAYNKLKGLLGVEVLSPKRLGMRVLKESGGLNKTHIDRHGRNILLQKAMTQVQDQLSLYKSSVQKTGFLEKIGALISELKENDLGPEAFKKVTDDGILKQKLADIGLIYEKYNALMGDEHIDEEDLQELFCQKIRDCQFLKNAKIFIDGFQNFSFQDYRLIENLMIQAKELVIGLPLDLSDRDAEVFNLTANTFERLKMIAASHQLSFSHQIVKEENSPKSEIQFLERNLYTYPPQTMPGPIKNIRLFQNQTIWDEVENNAQQILKLIREKNYAYKDMVVLAGDLDLYGDVIKGVFSQYQIPFFLDELRPIGDNHLIEALITALEAIASNYRSDEILGYVKTGFSPVSLEDSRDLENYSLEFGIRGSLWKKPFTLDSQNPSLDLEKINANRLALMTPLENLRKKIKGLTSCAVITTALYEFLIETKVPETLDRLIDRLSEAEDYESLEAYQQIWNIMMKVFDQMVETIGSDEILIDEYVRLLKAGIQDYHLGVIPPQGDFINITDLRRSRSQAFSLLFILGLNEGKLPGAGSEPNLITDAERRILESHQVYLQNNLFFQMEQERFLIYDLFSRPQKSLFIHWALSDLEGNSLQPSPLLRRILTIFPDLLIESKLQESKDAVWDQINRPDLSLWKLIQYEKNQGPKDELAIIWAAVKEWIEASPYQSQYHNGLKALSYKGVDASMGASQAQRLYGKNMRTSISRLEQFVQCPFSHYLTYGLKPGKRLVYQLEAPEIGNLLHDLVDGFFKQVEVKELSSLKEEKKQVIIADLMKKILPTIKKNIFNSSYHYQYLGKKLQRVGKRSIDAIIDQVEAGKFLPEKTEFQFEKNLEASFGDVKIHGKIDRLDLYRKDGETWLKIIDYKTGKKTLRYEDIYFGLSLQLVVYLDGALTELNEENLLPGGIFYFYIDDPILRMDSDSDPEVFNQKLQKELTKAFKLNGLFLDDEAIIGAMDEKRDKRKSDILPLYTGQALLSQDQFQLLLAYVRDLVEKQIKEIYGGQIKAQPYKKDQITACTYCQYQGICQFDEEITKEGYWSFKKAMTKEEFFNLIRGEADDEKLDQ